MTKLRHYHNLVYSLRWAPEIEVAFPGKENKIDFLDEHYRKFFKHWTITTDLTIEPEGREFKPKDSFKLRYNKESFQELKDVLAAIKSNGGKVNKSTGGHIHINAKRFSSIEIIKIVKEVIAREKYICEYFKINKNRLSHTCKMIKKSDIRNLRPELLDAYCSDKNDDFDISKCPILNSKYYFLNIQHLRDLGTLEFRLFEGTLSYKEIQKRVKFLFDFIIQALEKE